LENQQNFISFHFNKISALPKKMLSALTTRVAAAPYRMFPPASFIGQTKRFMSSHKIPRFTEEHKKTFDKIGYVMLRKLFDEEEVKILIDAARGDSELSQHVFGLEDGKGGKRQV
jgi:hypothetical protein